MPAIGTLLILLKSAATLIDLQMSKGHYAVNEKLKLPDSSGGECAALDTHIRFWASVDDKDSLSPKALRAIKGARRKWISAVSCWDLAKLVERKRIGFSIPVLDWFIDAAKADGALVCAQRLGWLMEKAGNAALAKGLAGFIGDKNPPFTRLDPSLPAADSEKDSRWRLMINTDVDGDL